MRNYTVEGNVVYANNEGAFKMPTIGKSYGRPDSNNIVDKIEMDILGTSESMKRILKQTAEEMGFEA